MSYVPGHMIGWSVLCPMRVATNIGTSERRSVLDVGAIAANRLQILLTRRAASPSVGASSATSP